MQTCKHSPWETADRGWREAVDNWIQSLSRARTCFNWLMEAASGTYKRTMLTVRTAACTNVSEASSNLEKRGRCTLWMQLQLSLAMTFLLLIYRNTDRPAWIARMRAGRNLIKSKLEAMPQKKDHATHRFITQRTHTQQNKRVGKNISWRSNGERHSLNATGMVTLLANNSQEM